MDEHDSNTGIQLWLDEYEELSEEDFYPPKDNRLYKTLIYNMNNENDCFDNFVKSFYEYYENDLFNE